MGTSIDSEGRMTFGGWILGRDGLPTEYVEVSDAGVVRYDFTCLWVTHLQ